MAYRTSADRLTKQERKAQAFELRVKEKLSHRDIASRLSISAGTVSTYLNECVEDNQDKIRDALPVAVATHESLFKEHREMAAAYKDEALSGNIKAAQIYGACLTSASNEQEKISKLFGLGKSDDAITITMMLDRIMLYPPEVIAEFHAEFILRMPEAAVEIAMTKQAAATTPQYALEHQP